MELIDEQINQKSKELIEARNALDEMADATPGQKVEIQDLYEDALVFDTHDLRYAELQLLFLEKYPKRYSDAHAKFVEFWRKEAGRLKKRIEYWRKRELPPDDLSVSLK